MSRRGRGSYRGRGRYGRGNNRTHKTNFNGTNKKTTTSNLYDLNSASKSTNNFEEVNRNVLTNIRKVYGTLVHQALVDRKHIDFNDSKLKPQRQTSTATDPDTKASEEAEYDTDFKAAIAQYAKDKAAYNDKMGKVIAVLWSQCTRELQIKIEERADYMTHIKDDAIAPMNAIEEHAMGYDKSKLKLEIIGDAIRNLFMIRQKEEEELISYYERFTSATKPLTKHFGGQINIISLIDDMKKKNPTMNEKDIQIEEWNRFLAFYFIERSDHDKYGVFIEGLKSQETMGHTQFPKTIEEARAILSARTFEDKYEEKLSKKKSSTNNKSQSNNQEFKTDHTSVMSEITLAQTEGVCYCCGKKGHLSSKCRFKDKPKSEWHMNKAKEIQNLMKHASANTTAENETIVEIPAQTTQQSSVTL